MATGTNNRPTSNQLGKTAQQSQVTVCKRCTAPHFSYQLSCKRCGEYFNNEDAPPKAGSTGVMVLAATAIVAVIIAACQLLHIL